VVVAVAQVVSRAHGGNLDTEHEGHEQANVAKASPLSALEVSVVVPGSAEVLGGAHVLSWVHLKHVWVSVVAIRVWLGLGWESLPWGDRRTAIDVSVSEFLTIKTSSILLHNSAKTQFSLYLYQTSCARPRTWHGTARFGRG